METKDTCLYIHTRKSDAVIFYVGIGNDKRPYTKSKRNKFWKSVVNKHDYEVTILKTGMSWKDACELEIKMIAFYGRIRPNKDNLNYGCLVNMTDGGDGVKGLIQNEEKNKKHSQRMTGKGNPNFGKSDRFKGEKNPYFGKGYKLIGDKNGMYKKTHSDDAKKKMRKPRSDEGKKNMRENHADFSGEKHPQAKKVICIITNKIYGCIKDAAEDIKVKPKTLSNWLKGLYPNKSSLRYL
jgi:hypothetical protein